MAKRYLLLLAFFCLFIGMWATVKPRKGGRAVQSEHQIESSSPSTSETDCRSPMKIGLHSNAPLTSLGSPKVPVVLVQYSDKKFTSGLGTYIDENGNELKNECTSDEDAALVNSYYKTFCNGDGSHNYDYQTVYGGITDYFRDQSNGLFTPEFVIIGPVTLSEGYAYYGENSESSKDKNIRSFYSESITLAQSLMTDWSQFDNDSNGSCDMVFFIYAGEGENGCDDPNTIWPKESASGGSINGTRYGCYACCNEIYNDNPDGIGVFVHELSHALGLPDFYDVGYKAYGMDYWDIMDSGCYNNYGYTPSNYTAYEREFMGWLDIETLDPEDGVRELTLSPMSAFGNAYKIVNPENSNEYYILENKQSTDWDLFVGRGTVRTKMHGLMITHVDYQQSSWTSNRVNTDIDHQRMTIMPADGALYSYMDVNNTDDFNDYMNSAIRDLFPGYDNVKEFSGEAQYVFTESGSTPHQMGQPLFDITENEDGSMTLYYMGLPDAINGLFANPKHGVGVFDITGVRVGTTDIEYGNPTRLPNRPGVYVVNGKKYIKD